MSEAVALPKRITLTVNAEMSVDEFLPMISLLWLIGGCITKNGEEVSWRSFPLVPLVKGDVWEINEIGEGSSDEEDCAGEIERLREFCSEKGLTFRSAKK